ncbi:hypothetical protein F5X68DRAFT_226751 [Plectosphaerella plurivora]|uniref:Uncharacterized protein n=1 Tax=Plectosphaerella plurivora TaxID=936078 RepID=A0A9P8VPJ2_9PEZI|nr:hypothetical protein F5X68DRAFT_226751 [Plectosphaerella plurivora]
MTMAIAEQHDFFFGSGAPTRFLFPHDETNLTSNRDAQKAAANAENEEELRQQRELGAQDEIKKLTASNQTLKEGKERAERDLILAEERAEEDLISTKGKLDMAEQERKVAEMGKELAEETNRLLQKEMAELKGENTKLVEENNKLDVTIERMVTFEGCEVYLYNIFTKVTIDYDHTRKLRDGGRPVGPPSFRIENIKSKCCLEFRHSGIDTPLYASLYEYDASQHWYCQDFTGQKNLIGRGNFALVNVKYKTAMCLVDSGPPRPGVGVEIVSNVPNTSYSNQLFTIVARPIREGH